jgi:hypothetical protein
MDPIIGSLCERLRQTVDLLYHFGEHDWAMWLREGLSWIEHDDFSGVERVLAAYGGMGSFTDLVLHPSNGSLDFDAECKLANEQLESLRSEMFDLAQEIRRAFLLK